MVKLVVVFCLALNPYLCRNIEMVPGDGRAIASAGECLRGGAIGGMSFVLEHAEWQVKGWRCVERRNEVAVWLRDRQGGH